MLSLSFFLFFCQSRNTAVFFQLGNNGFFYQISFAVQKSYLVQHLFYSLRLLIFLRLLFFLDALECFFNFSVVVLISDGFTLIIYELKKYLSSLSCVSPFNFIWLQGKRYFYIAQFCNQLLSIAYHLYVETHIFKDELIYSPLNNFQDFRFDPDIERILALSGALLYVFQSLQKIKHPCTVLL